MKWTQVEVRWSELKSRAGKTWGRLTQDDLEGIRGRRDLLVEKLSGVYGLAKAAAKRQVADFARNAGAASGRVVVRAKSSLKGAVSAAKGAGGHALEKTLDQASAGLDNLKRVLPPAEGKDRAESAVPPTRLTRRSQGVARASRQRKPRRP